MCQLSNFVPESEKMKILSVHLILMQIFLGEFSNLEKIDIRM